MITTLEQPYTELQLKSILHPLINQWFFSKFKEFSLPQLHGVMEIHNRKNVLISAPTGSTKTLTGFLAILNELVDSAKKGILEDKIYCVYISPLKALNADIHHNLITPLQEMEALAGKKLGIRVAVRTGDTTASEKAKMLKFTPHILITTPESLAIILNSPKFSEKLKDVQWLIVDEIHALAENKRGVHLSVTIERLQRIS
ncbi:MAG TPA: DEAD/DEAH box helicase, partial [Candidatus Nanoarchaeia archaeon]|nr:DEAD/DEAH box helicase [Candidatus Nanoarchaeia archaeon]